MSPELIYPLCAIVAALAVVLSQFLPRILARGKAGLKSMGIDLSPETLAALESLAQLGIACAEEQAQKWIKSLQREGKPLVTIANEKLAPEQKEQIAVAAMRTLAPTAQFSDAQAKVVIEAVLQKQRSIIPLELEQEIRASVPPGTVYRSVPAGSLAPSPAQLESLEKLRLEVIEDYQSPRPGKLP